MKKTGAELRREIEARMRHYAKTSPLFYSDKKFDAEVKVILRPKPADPANKKKRQYNGF
jgi:hypothetical protein